MEQKNNVYVSDDAMTGGRYPSNDDEIDLRELFAVIWKGKIVITLCTLICASIAVAYALMVQEQWTAKARVIAPRLEIYVAHYNQLTQLNSIIGVGSWKDGSYIFSKFIEEFNLEENKREFLGKNAEYQSLVADLTEDGVLALNKEIFSGIYAGPMNEDKPKEPSDGSYILSFQAVDRESSANSLREYIDFVNKKSNQFMYSNLLTLIDVKRIELEQSKDVLVAKARAQLKTELLRAESSLKLAQASKMDSPIQDFGGDLFPIHMGALAIEEKVNALRNLNDLSILVPELNTINVQLAFLNKFTLDKDIQFLHYRVLEAVEKPLTRDKPKRALIAVLGTLLGGMLGVAFVLVKHAFGRKEETL